MEASVLLVLAVPLFATMASPPARPRVPYESTGACPGECCAYGPWRVKEDAAAFAHPVADSPVAFRLRKGEAVEGLTGIVRTTKLGRAVVRKPTSIGAKLKLDVKPTDEIVVLFDRGEGYWRVWLRGQVDDAELPDEGARCQTENGQPVECEVQIVSRPQTVWWSKVRSRAGREGWTREMNHFSGVYLCGE
jgi:hypothetical protein